MINLISKTGTFTNGNTFLVIPVSELLITGAPAHWGIIGEGKDFDSALASLKSEVKKFQAKKANKKIAKLLQD